MGGAVPLHVQCTLCTTLTLVGRNPRRLENVFCGVGRTQGPLVRVMQLQPAFNRVILFCPGCRHVVGCAVLLHAVPLADRQIL